MTAVALNSGFYRASEVDEAAAKAPALGCSKRPKVIIERVLSMRKTHWRPRVGEHAGAFTGELWRLRPWTRAGSERHGARRSRQKERAALVAAR